MQKHFKRLLLPVVILMALLIVNPLQSQDNANTQSELSGTIEVRFNDPFAINFKGPSESFLLLDSKKRKMTELDIEGLDKKLLKPGKRVKIKGNFKTKEEKFNNKVFKRKVLKASKITYDNGLEADSDDTAEETVDLSLQTAENEPLSPAGPTTTSLNCLLIYANTLDWTYPTDTPFGSDPDKKL